MTTLGELAKLVRSKNAGPFTLVFDLMFERDEDYRRALASHVLDPARVAALYGVDASVVRLFCYDQAYALKLVLPRPCPSGDVGDRDIFGGQQYGPLVELPVEPP